MQLALTQTLPIDLARRLLERAKKMTLTPGGNGVRYEPTVTLGQVILLLPILGMVAFYAINKGDTADSARQQVSDLRTDMNKRFDSQAIETNKRFDSLVLQISGLPTQAAKVEQLVEENRQLTTRIDRDEARQSDIGN